VGLAAAGLGAARPDAGWRQIALEILVLAVWNDVHFWVNHRLLHTRWLRRFHGPHHRSFVTTPWATYSFHPIEALMLGNVILLPMVVHDFSFWSLAAVPVFSLFFNCVGHSNYDFFTGVSYSHWFAASRRHHLHHAVHNGNYGFQFTFMDRLFRTRIAADAAEPHFQAFHKKATARERSQGSMARPPPPDARHRLPRLRIGATGRAWPTSSRCRRWRRGNGCMASTCAVCADAVPHARHRRDPSQPRAPAHVARAAHEPADRFLDHAAAGPPDLRVLARARGQPPSPPAWAEGRGAHLPVRRRHQPPVGLPAASVPGGVGADAGVRRVARAAEAHRRGAWRYCMAQYALWLASWAVLLALDWRKALLFVIVPQLHGLHWLLATNYLQHAHADGRKPRAQRGARRYPGRQLNYARNFEGLVNPLLFNIGLHTAHHENPHAHWSELTHLHRTRYRARGRPCSTRAGWLPTWCACSCWGPCGRAFAAAR
jgi:hypothetical protein